MDEEDEFSFYANLEQIEASPDQALETSDVKKREPYDEVTVNFGKPVIQPHPGSVLDHDSIFSSVCFTSPIAGNGVLIPPVPAPRLSKQQKKPCDIIQDHAQAVTRPDPELGQAPPQVPPRNVMLSPETVYEEIRDDANAGDKYLSLGGAVPRRRKADTIDIRNTISQWYDDASDEVARDLSLDLSILDQEAIILEESENEVIEVMQELPRQVQAPATLLRNFDPIFSQDELKSELEKSGQNHYTSVPFANVGTRTSTTSSVASYSSEPPNSPPPPLPQTAPPSQPLRPPVAYENIWIEPNSKPQLGAPPVPPRLKAKQPSFMGPRNDDSAISSSASSSSNDLHALSATPTSSGSGPQRSFSALNLATKLASNIKRKMSDQHIVIQGRVSNPKLSHRAKSALLTPSGLYQSHVKTRSGVLYIYSRSRRSFQPKWCVLNHADFKYFNDKQTVAIPKETIGINTVLSLQKHCGEAFAQSNVEIFTFNLAYFSNKHQILTLGAASVSERDKWMDKIIHNLGNCLKFF